MDPIQIIVYRVTLQVQTEMINPQAQILPVLVLLVSIRIMFRFVLSVIIHAKLALLVESMDVQRVQQMQLLLESRWRIHAHAMQDIMMMVRLIKHVLLVTIHVQHAVEETREQIVWHVLVSSLLELQPSMLQRQPINVTA